MSYFYSILIFYIRLALREKAKELNIVSYLVADAGKTQIPSGTRTVLGLGPDTVERIDAVTRSLGLLK